MPCQIKQKCKSGKGHQCGDGCNAGQDIKSAEGLTSGEWNGLGKGHASGEGPGDHRGICQYKSGRVIYIYYKSRDLVTLQLSSVCCTVYISD